MKYLRRSIDLIRDGQLTASQLSDTLDTRLAVRVELDGKRHRIGGWYRLKHIFTESEPEQISIEAMAADGSRLVAWTAVRPGRTLAAYIYMPKAAAVRFEFAFAATAGTGIRAKLRPIGLPEYVWRKLTQGIVRDPRRFLSAFLRPPTSTFLLFNLPSPPPPQSDYSTWIETQEPRIVAQHLAGGHATATDPQISILLYAGSTSTDRLKRTLASVQNQSSQRWRLLLTYGPDAGKAVTKLLHEAAGKDGRITVVRANTPDSAAALNDLLAMVQTPYVWRLHENDELAPFAIEACERPLAAQPDCRILVADDDKLDRDGQRSAPRFKPRTFTIELFHSYNYFGRATVLHTQAVRDAGGWRTGFSGAGDYDLLLRLIDTNPRPSIQHLALVLYHERLSSDRQTRAAASSTTESGRRALEEHFARTSVPVTVEHIPTEMYRIRYRLDEPKPLLSIMIPFRDRADLLQQCVSSVVDKSTYRHFEVLLINNGSTEPATLDLLERYKSDNRIRVIDDPRQFNYSELNNGAARVARGDFYCLLNNDTQVVAADWMEDMLGYAAQPGVGCVGAKLLYPDGSVQHAGMILGLPSGAEHAFRFAAPNDPGYLNRLAVASNYPCVTGACLMINRKIFWEVGGLDEALPVTFNDVDLCIKVFKAGYRNVFTPFARLFHFEASTRGSDLLPENMIRFRNELDFMKARYGRDLMYDAHYSPHLTHTKTDFSIRLDYDNA